MMDALLIFPFPAFSGISGFRFLLIRYDGTYEKNCNEHGHDDGSGGVIPQRKGKRVTA